MMAIVPDSETSIYFKPIVIAIGDDEVAFGQKCHFPNKAGAKIPEEFHG